MEHSLQEKLGVNRTIVPHGLLQAIPYAKAHELPQFSVTERVPAFVHVVAGDKFRKLIVPTQSLPVMSIGHVPSHM